MDLSLLPHLSDEALREEAQRRGIATAHESRDAIIAAIRESERPKPEARAAEKRGMFGAARKLLGRVIRGVLEREPSPPRPVAPPEPREPIPTRAMAELLIDQDHLQRAIGILSTLDGDDARARLAEIEARLVRSRLTKAAAAHRSFGVAILGERGARAVTWRVEASGVARARALLGRDGELTLRIVTVEVNVDHAVTSRSRDRGPIEARGFELLDVEPGARIVISVGLRAGDRFVSIVHTAG